MSGSVPAVLTNEHQLKLCWMILYFCSSLHSVICESTRSTVDLSLKGNTEGSGEIHGPI